MTVTETVPTDVFAAARWLDSLWNSNARAVSADLVEWQCNTWGSGQGRGYWTDTAVHVVVAAVLDLQTGSNDDGRDELIVWVPVDQFPHVHRLIDRLGENPEDWPWRNEEDRERQLALAAEVLGISPAALADNGDLLDALQME